MKLIYNLGILLYYAIVYIVSFFDDKAKKFIEGRKNVFSFLAERIVYNDKFIWMHVSSLGEFEQGRPIIEAIRREHPEYKIILTFFSPSGYEVRKNYDGAEIVCYLPMDTSWNAKRFVRLVNPSIAIFIKYEFWGNYLSELKKNKVPTYIVSAIFRDNQVFFRPYGGWYRSFLYNFEHLFVQDEKSRNLLASVGIKNVSIVGDTRFDRVLAIAKASKELPIVAAFKANNRVLVAGSSWPKDEAFLLPYFNEHSNMKLIIAPHEIHESHIEDIVSKLKRPYVRYSKTTPEEAAKADCLIIDCFGLLSSIYRYGEVAYVGGGFGVGIHNILEAAVYGMPVVFGPNYHKFREAVEMVKVGGAFPVNDGNDFSRVMDDLMEVDSDSFQRASAEARQFVSNNCGATDAVLKAVFKESSK
ncbi:MAG: 3-deoxy-D-manno-octulosonic acid transferase [Paludibacteraceae bacterium]|nr:3-deoxy-D-manno-octulosonic acid transferase [Paludibacteraceae bacterium]MBR4841295.1 3-deoxy-D-manno-octulosonic acid transferase [Paludibacteraceae bacterium]